MKNLIARAVAGLSLGLLASHPAPAGSMWKWPASADDVETFKKALPPNSCVLRGEVYASPNPPGKATTPDGRILIVTGGKDETDCKSAWDGKLHGSLKVYNFDYYEGNNEGLGSIVQNWIIQDESVGVDDLDHIVYFDVVNGDGRGNPLAMVMYQFGGTDHSGQTKLITYFKDKKYAIRGYAKCSECSDGPFKTTVTPDSTLASLPPAVRGRIWQAWRENFEDSDE